MKNTKLFILIIIFITNYCNASYREDIKGAQRAGENFAKTFPFATGLICDESSGCQSGIFLDKKTFLTCAHGKMTRKNEKFFVVNDNKIDLLLFKNKSNGLEFNFSITINNIKKQKMSFPKSIYNLCNFEKIKTTVETSSDIIENNIKTMNEQNQKIYFEKEQIAISEQIQIERKTWQKNPDNIFSAQKMNLNGEA